MDDSDTYELVSGNLFAAFASVSIERWKEIEGCRLVHVERGDGLIEKSIPRNGNPLLTIQFHESSESVKFNSIPFQNDRVKLDLRGTLREAFDSWLVAEMERERIKKEKERIRREEDERRRREEEAERERRRREEEAERERRRREEEAERERIRQVTENIIGKYRILVDKYRAPVEHLVDGDKESLLCSILQKIDSNEVLAKHEIAWLEVRGLPHFIAEYFFLRYENSGDLWDLAKTCSYWRSADLPERAVEISKNIELNPDVRAWSALQTSRGGALRDLGRFEEARSCGLAAIKQTPSSFHPHMLLGAVYFDLADYDRGHEHFTKAEKLGASRHVRNSAIKEKLETLAGDELREFMEHLTAFQRRRSFLN